jgi:hypothetical protein
MKPNNHNFRIYDKDLAIEIVILSWVMKMTISKLFHFIFLYFL